MTEICPWHRPTSASVETLQRLIYRSRSTIGDPLADMEDILKVSVWNNARARITGVLGHYGACYVQLLEGPAPALDSLLQQLRVDQRHTELLILDRREVAARLFPGWSMARSDIFGAYAPAASVANDGRVLALRLVDLFRRGETAVV